MTESNRYEVIVLPGAQRDIRDIVLYISRDLMAPAAALALNRKLSEQIQGLSYMPERIKLIDVEPWNQKKIRRLCVKNYYVYFGGFWHIRETI